MSKLPNKSMRVLAHATLPSPPPSRRKHWEYPYRTRHVERSINLRLPRWWEYVGKRLTGEKIVLLASCRLLHVNVCYMLHVCNMLHVCYMQHGCFMRHVCFMLRIGYMLHVCDMLHFCPNNKIQEYFAKNVNEKHTPIAYSVCESRMTRKQNFHQNESANCW